MGYEPRYDIPQYDFTRDLAHGEAGEGIVKDFLDAMSTGSFEVKFDRYRNGRMAVETDQCPRGKEWKKSGINVTTATWWVYMFSPTSFIIVSVIRLKNFLRLNADILQKRDLARGENPSKGFLLFPEHVQDLMNNADYD